MEAGCLSSMTLPALGHQGADEPQPTHACAAYSWRGTLLVCLPGHVPVWSESLVRILCSAWLLTSSPSLPPSPRGTLNVTDSLVVAVRGGRGDVSWYNSLIEHCKRAGSVLTEHIGKPSIEAMGETGVSESFIYTRDVDWLADAHAVVAEVTQPSLGVGYELGFAEAHRIPTLCL